LAEKDQFYSFDEALKELRLKEEELKRLVSEGEIRAFREGDTMKLRRADVETLRSELSGGEVVDLGEGEADLVFEDDPDGDEAGMATQEISDVDTLLEEPVEEVAPEIEIEEEAAEEAAPAPALASRAVVEPEVELPTEPRSTRVLFMLTAVLLLLAMPLCISVLQGMPSSLSGFIRGLIPL